MDKQYSSQPTDKHSKWILSKWRTLKSNTEGSIITVTKIIATTYCYSAVFFKNEKLDKQFWGTLLGYGCNRNLFSNHVEGWVGRLIKWRSREVQKNPTLLVKIQYWKLTRRPERTLSFVMNDDFVRSPNELYGNEAFCVCMTIHGRSNVFLALFTEY
ncbi:hypothetical protein R6Q57_012447 [Mikania cordata]